MYSSSNNLKELIRDNINEILSGKRIEKETTDIIIKYLIAMNKEGFITFESQPISHTVHKNPNRIWINRAYINGFYPSDKIAYLIRDLKETSKDIVISETYLHRNGNDELLLWNFNKNDYLKGKYYPMSLSLEEDSTFKYHEGYSGNISSPAIREDYMENFNDDLLSDIYENGISLIQIWSKNINDDIFPIVLECLRSTNQLF